MQQATQNQGVKPRRARLVFFDGKNSENATSEKLNIHAPRLPRLTSPLTSPGEVQLNLAAAYVIGGEVSTRAAELTSPEFISERNSAPRHIEEFSPRNKPLGCACVTLGYRRTLISGVTKSPTACPSHDCTGSLARTRTVPTRQRLVLRVRLYECDTCNKTIETVEAVTSSDYTKRYVARIEAHRGQRKARTDVEDEDDKGLNAW